MQPGVGAQHVKPVIAGLVGDARLIDDEVLLIGCAPERVNDFETADVSI
jgi:hypothetical protein